MYYLANAAMRPLPQPLPFGERLAIAGFFTFAAIITAARAANSMRKGVFRGKRGRSWTRRDDPGVFWFNVIGSFVTAMALLGFAAYVWFSEMRIH